MNQIVIRVSNKEKAQMLFELLHSLDFVDSVETSETGATPPTASEEDFFALMGIWQDRPIDLKTLRSKAWPRQTS